MNTVATSPTNHRATTRGLVVRLAALIVAAVGLWLLMLMFGSNDAAAAGLTDLTKGVTSTVNETTSAATTTVQKAVDEVATTASGAVPTKQVQEITNKLPAQDLDRVVNKVPVVNDVVPQKTVQNVVKVVNDTTANPGKIVSNVTSTVTSTVNATVNSTVNSTVVTSAVNSPSQTVHHVPKPVGSAAAPIHVSKPAHTAVATNGATETSQTSPTSQASQTNAAAAGPVVAISAQIPTTAPTVPTENLFTRLPEATPASATGVNAGSSVGQARSYAQVQQLQLPLPQSPQNQPQPGTPGNPGPGGNPRAQSGGSFGPGVTKAVTDSLAGAATVLALLLALGYAGRRVSRAGLIPVSPG